MEKPKPFAFIEIQSRYPGTLVWPIFKFPKTSMYFETIFSCALFQEKMFSLFLISMLKVHYRIFRKIWSMRLFHQKATDWKVTLFFFLSLLPSYHTDDTETKVTKKVSLKCLNLTKPKKNADFFLCTQKTFRVSY